MTDERTTEELVDDALCDGPKDDVEGAVLELARRLEQAEAQLDDYERLHDATEALVKKQQADLAEAREALRAGDET